MLWDLGESEEKQKEYVFGMWNWSLGFDEFLLFGGP